MECLTRCIPRICATKNKEESLLPVAGSVERQEGKKGNRLDGMKPGDKVWVWNAWGDRPHQIERGELVEIEGAGALVKLSGRERPYKFLVCEIFPTREALCEHYRKIFE